MLPRILPIFLLGLACVFLVCPSWANDPRSADMSATVVVPPESHICVFRITLIREFGATPEDVKKVMAPYPVVDIREVRTLGKPFVCYIIRISCQGDTKGLIKKLLREHLPLNHPDRVRVNTVIVSLQQLPENTKLPIGKK